jgi:hypothetical protein
VHLAIDDHSRLAYSEILPDEKRASCLRFLFNALRFFRAHGVKVERVMTDNGASIARMGLRSRLLHVRRTRRRTAEMAAPLQLASTSRRHRSQAANQQTRPNRGQPLEAPRLEHFQV